MDMIFWGGISYKTKLSQSIANGISNIKVNIDLKKECLMTKCHLNTPLGIFKMIKMKNTTPQNQTTLFGI